VCVQPGQTLEYAFELNVAKPGEFEVHPVMFLEDHGIRRVEFIFRGVGVEAKSSANANNTP